MIFNNFIQNCLQKEINEKCICLVFSQLRNKLYSVKMKSNLIPNHVTSAQALINPEILWAIENELIDIPLQYRDNFWNELLASYSNDMTRTE